MTVDRLAPDPGPVEAEELAAALADAPSLEPFADEAVDWCGALSSAIFVLTGARRHPELVALARWLRPASCSRCASSSRA